MSEYIGYALFEGMHRCSGSKESDDCNFISTHGTAFDYCYERSDGALFIDCNEYCSRVNFCPVCGYKAKSQELKPQ